ncbi:MAG: sigma-54 dependent transcriptional regulator [Chitinispirillaceae bacterium]|jgi:DNA-binding NtrC family response regulator|nr:sigma-54 dependent transcriptional regulator [Chitinispirillaceae bacterium]
MKNPRLLLVDDDTAIQYGYKRYFANTDYRIMSAVTLKEAKAITAAEQFDAILLDLQLPDGDSIDWLPELRLANPTIPIIIITGTNDIQVAVKALKCGAENFLIKPVVMDDLSVILERCLEQGSLRKRDYIQKRLGTQSSPYFGKSKATAEIMAQAKIAASSDTVVLLQGETGTGKGVLARWIHNNSERKSDAFIEVNCSMLKGDLLRSELFGHAKGSFTSAIAAKEGLIELADGGTLFLDEIGDMSLEVQAQLLKTIEEKSFRRLGDNALRKSDFRLICATNRDLKALTKEFRRDLYFRICTFPISLPPLRKRDDEIPGLADYFLSNFGYSHLPLAEDVLLLLAGYSWPGNTREFKNVLERALLLAQGEPLTPLHFPDLSADLTNEKPQDLDNAGDAHIMQVFEKFNGDKVKTCKALGLSLSSLYRRLAKIADAAQ